MTLSNLKGKRTKTKLDTSFYTSKTYLFFVLFLTLLTPIFTSAALNDTSLLQHYSFDVNNITFQRDNTSYGNNLTATGTWTQYKASCKIGGCFNKTSTEKWTTVNNVGINGSQPRTTNYWANVPSGTAQGFASYGAGIPGQQWEADINSGNFRLAWYGAAATIASVDNNQWTMITIVYNGTTIKGYKNGVNTANQTQALSTAVSTMQLQFVNAPEMMDEFSQWNRTLSDAEIAALYANESAGIGYPWYVETVVINSSDNVTFKSQSPANVTAVSVFTQNVNITYSFNNTNLTNPLLNYTIYHGGDACLQFINASCQLANNTFKTLTWSGNSTSGTLSNFSFLLGENQLYPMVANLNDSFFSGLHSVYNLSADSSFLSTRLENISVNEQFNILEIMALSTGQARVYACNSSYTLSSNVLSSSYCQELQILSSSYNHTHGANSSHQLVPFKILNGRVGGNGIGASGVMYFMVRGSLTGVNNVSYVSASSKVGDTRTSTNNGNAWTNQTFSVDMHLHQYNGDTYLKYKGQGTYNGSVQNSSFTSELIDVPNLAPSQPVITVPDPNGYNQSSRFMNITYVNATAFLGTISTYNITLLNSDQSFNRTIINNSIVNVYQWDVYSQNLSLGEYYVKVEAIQSDGLKSYDFEKFNLTRNALINISAKTLTDGSTINNFSGYVYDYSLLTNTSYNTTNGNAYVDVVRGDFLVYLDGDDYAIVNTTNWQNLTVDQPVENITFRLYETNTVNITFYYEDTLLAVANNTLNISLDLISDLYGGNYSTSTGQLYITTLIPEDYVIRYSAPGYTQRFFFVEINNKSFQSLRLYLINETTKSNISIYIIDELTNAVEGAHVKALKYDITTNSYLLQEIGVTDVTGKTILSLTKNDEYYKFMIEQDGVLKKTTEPAYITSDSLTIQITTGSTVGDEYFQYYNIWYDLSFNNNTNNFRFDYDDTNAEQLYAQYCLFTYNWSKGGKTLLNSSCLTTQSGTILLPVPAANGTTYEAKAYYYILTKPYLIDSLIYEFPSPDKFGTYGLFLQVIVSLFFGFSAFFSIAVMVVAVPFSLILGKILHLNILSWGGLITLQITGIILALFLSKKN